VVAGGDEAKAVEKVLDVHKTVENSGAKIAEIAGLDIADKLAEHQGEYVAGHLESAELIKVTANAFLALKISFSNSIAKLCDETGANITEVMAAVGSDKRIGRAFLNAGRGYGGGCFPKDVSGLISSALEHGVDMPIMTSAVDVNESMHGYILNKAELKVGPLADKKIAVLGLAFKPGTSDARKSPAVAIANQLAKIGAKVTAYDPEANKEATPELRRGIEVKDSLEKAINDTDIIFVATEWPEFKKFTSWKQHAPKLTAIVDCMNCLDDYRITDEELTLIGVGR
ncbi:MAG: nucleotide sugar dehydrogenase, partial [bacterium]|nr:nucleotide sugar dehydrogenase [bacterium]